MARVFSFSREVNDVDAVHFFLGHKERCNVAMTMAGVLGGDVEYDELAEIFLPIGDELPRWKDYLRPAPWDLTAPTWTPSVNGTLSEHFSSRCLPPGTSWDSAWDVLDELQNAPFVDEKPPWQILLLKGVPGGRSILAFKVHHAFSDGTAFALMFGKVFMRAALAASGFTLDVISAPPPNGRAREAWSRWRGAVGDWGRYVTATPKSCLRDPHKLIQESTGVGSYLRRPRWPRARQSAMRRSTAFRIPLDVWRVEAAKRHGGINELYLGLAARIMREYFDAEKLDAKKLRVVMPVSTRPANGLQDGGNLVRVGIVELSGRAGDLDDLADLRRHAMRAKEEARAYSPAFVDMSARLLPGGLRANLELRRFSANDVLATSMIVPEGEILNVPFEMVFMIAPVMGIPTSFALATYGKDLLLTANSDIGLVTDPGRLERCARTCLERVFGGDSVTTMRAL